MSSNQEIIKKADIALSDLATAGRLNPEQTDQFIRTLIDTPTILQNVRTVAMNAPTMNVNKIGFGSRILSAANQTESGGGFPDRYPTSGVKPALSKIQLNTSEVIAEVNIPYEVIEDNVERGNITGGLQDAAGGLHQTIVDLIAERSALDLEELAINGLVGSPDPYLALQNGFLALAQANVVNAGQVISKDVLKAGLKTMPTRYLRNRAALMQFISVQNETELRDQYASRQTPGGDADLRGNLPLYIHGTKIAGVPLMPQSNGLFTDPLNLIFGIQRNIMIEYTKDIRARVFVIVLTARIAFQIEEVNAIVQYTNLQ